jgi:hypothetical protein
MSYAKPSDEQHKTGHAGMPSGANRRRGRLRRTVAIAAALAGVAFLAAACGGGSASTTAPSTSQGSNSTGDGVAYSQCMRARGVPNFPDPDPKTPYKPFNGPYLTQAGVNPGSPRAEAAEQACQHLYPNIPITGAQRQQLLSQMLRYSACMRAHGVADFPDPTTANGGVQLSLTQSAVDSPQYQPAAQACQSIDPGLQVPTNSGKTK